MTPHQTSKPMPKVQSRIVKTNAPKRKIATSVNTMTVKKPCTEKNPVKSNTILQRDAVTIDKRQRMNTVPKTITPKPKDNKKVPLPGSVSAVKSRKSRPKPAHSGVPVPEKMRILRQKLQEADCSF
ncbi:hypothetical protein ACJJTC_018611 [Scirpophaga incertulas]